MKVTLNILIAGIIIEAALCAFIRLSPHEDTKTLTSTTTELLSSFNNCIVYIFDWAHKSDYDSLASTRYIRFYSEYTSCAVIVETYRQYRNSTFNQRFDKLEPHPLFTKYTGNLLNLYTPNTVSTILKKVNPVYRFYKVILVYNIPFNYVLIFMTNEEFYSVGNVGLFCKLATVSSPAVYLLILDEQEVNAIGFAHAFQTAPFLFKVTNFGEAYFQEVNSIIHKDMQGAISLLWSFDSAWEKCRARSGILTHPHLCTLDVISANLNTTFLNEGDRPKLKLIVSEIVVRELLSPSPIRYMSRIRVINFNFVSYAVNYEEFNFICIAKVNTTGLMAFVQAYDLLTWIVVATTCLCLSATTASLATKTKASFWAKLQSSAPVVLMFLIERFYGYGQVIRSASRLIGLVMTLWAFGAMLLGMCYSGHMISELTSPSLKECPHDMQQLSEIVDYPIYTTMEFQKSHGFISYIHDAIDTHLAEYANNNGSLLPVLRQFGKTLTIPNGSTDLVPLSHDTGSKILLAYVAVKYVVRAYGMCSTGDRRVTQALRGGELPFFNSWAPMLVQSNFLGPIFQELIGNRYHCGIYEYWRDGFDAWTVIKALNNLGKRQQKGSWVELVRMFNLATIWRNFDPFYAGDAASAGMTLENLRAVFQFFGISILLALCVLIKERRLITVVGNHLVRMVMNAPLAVSLIADSFVMFLRMVVNRKAVAVSPVTT